MFEIGTTLRDARVRRDISLQQAEDDTKIRVKYIQAMENEDFDILPGGTYVKGFLRTYAEYLDLDAQLLIDEYNERFGSGEHREHIIQTVRSIKAEPSTKRARGKHQTNYILVAILAVVIVAVLAYLGWGNASSEKPTLVTTTETQTSESSAAATTPLVTPSRTATATTPTQTQAAEIQNIIISSTSSNNWIKINKNSADGEVVWSGTLATGESKTLEQKDLMGQNKLWLTVGSPEGLKVSVNGQPQKLTADVGEVYLITPSGMTRQA